MPFRTARALSYRSFALRLNVFDLIHLPRGGGRSHRQGALAPDTGCKMPKLIMALVATLALGACNVVIPSYLAAPAESVGTPPRYRSVTAGTGAFRPVEPKGWDEQNRTVTPRPGGGS